MQLTFLIFKALIFAMLALSEVLSLQCYNCANSAEHCQVSQCDFSDKALCRSMKPQSGWNHASTTTTTTEAGKDTTSTESSDENVVRKRSLLGDNDNIRKDMWYGANAPFSTREDYDTCEELRKDIPRACVSETIKTKEGVYTRRSCWHKDFCLSNKLNSGEQLVHCRICFENNCNQRNSAVEKYINSFNIFITSFLTVLMLSKIYY